MKTINVNNLIGLAGVTLGALGVGFMLGSQKNLETASENLGHSVEELLHSGSLSIPESMIERAVGNAVTHYANPKFEQAVKAEVGAFRKNAMAEIRTAAEAEITRQRDDLKADVVEALNTKIAIIGVDDICQGVIKAAAKQVSDRLDSDIERMVKSHEKHIEDTERIYASVAKTLTNQNGGDMLRIRLG